LSVVIRRPVTLLAIDDDPASLALINAALKRDDLEILTTEDPEAGLEIVRRRHPQIVLLDLIMPKLSGLEVLDRIIALDPTTDVVLITAHHSSETAVQAIQNGACDYLDKPLQLSKLRQRIGTLVTGALARDRARRLSEELMEASQFQGIVGRSPLMLDVLIGSAGSLLTSLPDCIGDWRYRNRQGTGGPRAPCPEPRRIGPVCSL
jgi:DNA-binding NtrC family response regulator